MVALVLVVSGCSKGIDMPKSFCDVAVRGDSLAPLLPSEGEVAVSKGELRDVICNLSVDGIQTLNVRISKIDKQLPAEDWANAISEFAQAGRRRTAFPGIAVIGANGALITANCGSPAAYVQFDVKLTGKQVQSSEAGAKKVQAFLEDFVPNVTKKLGCTG
ncbi:hypothetical protein [Streptomyces sp. NBC_00212]|uniref:hypothetical protein n=1 Tax=Streptomyces sp. NBC_00212 TaxID=2975684 RepID=UPI0032545D05